jgi:hypothetical protein
VILVQAVPPHCCCCCCEVIGGHHVSLEGFSHSMREKKDSKLLSKKKPQNKTKLFTKIQKKFKEIKLLHL